LAGHRIISSRSRYRLQDYYKFPDFSTGLWNKKHASMGIWEDVIFLALAFGSKRESPDRLLLEGASGLQFLAKMGLMHFPAKIGMKSAIMGLTWVWGTISHLGYYGFLLFLSLPEDGQGSRGVF
jgi:hypothetical protein